MKSILSKKISYLEEKAKIKDIEINHKIYLSNLLIPDSYDKRILPNGFYLSADIKLTDEKQKEYEQRLNDFYSFNEEYDKTLYKKLTEKRDIELRKSISNFNEIISIGIISDKSKNPSEIITINKERLIEVIEEGFYKFDLTSLKTFEITISSNIDNDFAIYKLFCKY